MTRPRKPAPPAIPAGHHVLLTHGLDDPKRWRVAEVLWSRADDILILDPWDDPADVKPIVLDATRAVGHVGTRAACLALLQAARDAERSSEPAMREANAALRQAQADRRAAIAAVVDGLVGDAT